MTPARRAALEQAGFRVGDAAEFVGMSAEERQMLQLRLRVAGSVARLRQRLSLTPQKAATRLNMKSAEVLAIEAGDASIPLDKAFQGLFRLGGTIGDLAPPKPRSKKVVKNPKPVPPATPTA